MGVPEISISRLSLYLRGLKAVSEGGNQTISSYQLAKETGMKPDKVRKDLSYFGQFGRRGIGYSVNELTDTITRILGLNKQWNVAICGAGNLGSALATYKGFAKMGFKTAAVFDNDPKKIGKSWGKAKIFHPKQIPRVTKQKKIEIAIIAVPADAAQSVIDKFIRAGIKAILNFAPAKLSLPKDVKSRNVDLSMELVNLTHFLSLTE